MVKKFAILTSLIIKRNEHAIKPLFASQVGKECGKPV
jgi:hypothetical protein